MKLKNYLFIKKTLCVFVVFFALCTMPVRAITIYLGSNIHSNMEYNTIDDPKFNWNHTTKTLLLKPTYDLGTVFFSDASDLITIKYSGQITIASTSIYSPVSSSMGPVTISPVASGDKLTLTSTSSQVLFCGGELIIDGGEIECISSLNESTIISSLSSIRIKDAKVTASYTGLMTTIYGIYANGDITVSGSSDVDISGTGYYGKALTCATLTISGGTMNLNYQTHANLYAAVLNLTGGTLTFNGGTAPTITSLSPNSGPDTGGTFVSVAGTFGTIQTVKVGNANATIFSSTADNGFITTPPGTPGSVNVIVVDDGGAYMLQNGFTYQVSGTTINLPTIQGLTPPVAGAIPVTTITETDQYTGTVSWSPADAIFKLGVQYTATVTLRSKSGYSESGVAANYFTVSGASSVTNAANSGIITAIFPVTQVASVTVTEITTQPSGGSVCLGGDFTFEVIAKGDDLTYQWYKGNNKIAGANKPDFVITNASSDDYDTYQVEVSGADKNKIFSEKVRLWVAEPLPALLSFDICPSTATTGHTYPIKLAGYMDVSKYTWSYSGNGVSFKPESGKTNETEATFSALAVGKGTLSVELEHVCGKRTVMQEVEVKYPTGINEISDEDVRIWPNPVVNELRIENGKLRIENVIITDIKGRIVFKSFSVPNSQFSVNCSGWAKGIYLVKINTDDGSKTIKILKK